MSVLQWIIITTNQNARIIRHIIYKSQNKFVLQEYRVLSFCQPTVAMFNLSTLEHFLIDRCWFYNYVLKLDKPVPKLDQRPLTTTKTYCYVWCYAICHWPYCDLSYKQSAVIYTEMCKTFSRSAWLRMEGDPPSKDNFFLHEKQTLVCYCHRLPSIINVISISSS